MEELIGKYIEDPGSFVSTTTGDLGLYLAVGILFTAILWVIGYTIRRLFGIFHEWTSR